MINRSSEAKKVTKGWNSVIQFNLDDKDKFYLEAKDGRLSFHDGESEKPSVTINTTNAIFGDLIKGKIKPDEAFLKGKYEIKGSIFDGARFNRLVNILLEGSTSKLLGIFRKFM
jgi:putative sterol carrier protein